MEGALGLKFASLVFVIDDKRDSVVGLEKNRLGISKGMHPKVSLGCWVLVNALALIIYFSPVNTFIDNRLLFPLNYGARTALGKNTPLDPSIVMFALDDKAVAALEKDDLNLMEWEKLLTSIADQKPAMIFIDKLFGTPGKEYDGKDFVANLAKLKVPIVSGLFLVPFQIPERHLINLNKPEFTLSNYVKSGDIADLDWIRIETGYTYGPSKRVEDGFSRKGHLLYDDNNTVQLFYRLSSDQAVPHWALSAAKDVGFYDGELRINNHQVNTHMDGRTWVDFVDLRDFKKNRFSLKPLIEGMKRNQSFTGVVNEGQYVIILPAMYTGNTDMSSTPFGRLPASYVAVSVVNSVISGKWLHSIKVGWLFILLVGALGVVLGSYAKPVWFWPSLLTGIILVTIVGLGFFVYEGIVIPWIMMASSLTLGSISVFAINTVIQDRENIRLKMALKDMVSKHQLDYILKNTNRLQLEPVGKIVSIMFVDVVGFSLASERLSPEESFQQIKDYLLEMKRIVHEHDGVVDKVLGDGLLCFFGYNLTGAVYEDHADRALETAIAIQKMSYEWVLSAFDKGKAVFPLRIGINTSSVRIGNMGDQTKIEFTIIGDGVNFAQRLENACEPFKILMGSTTKHQLIKFNKNAPNILRRFVKIKHHSELVETFEYNVLHGNDRQLHALHESYWVYAGVEREDERYSVAPGTIKVITEHGEFDVVDYSHSGLAITGQTYLARGVSLTAKISFKDEALSARLKQAEVAFFYVEVRWGQNTEGGFLHGVRITNLSKEQHRVLFACCAEASALAA